MKEKTRVQRKKEKMKEGKKENRYEVTNDGKREDNKRKEDKKIKREKISIYQHSRQIFLLFDRLSYQGCNIMAEGFSFMPLGLVRLRTYRLSAWVT